MAIHLSGLIRLSNIVTSCHRNKLPNYLSTCIAKRHIQEFPERKLDNLVPNDYVLILPETFDENDDTNELLKITKQHDIDYSRLNAENVFKGLSLAMCRFENYLTDKINQTNPDIVPASQFFKELEQQLYPLDSALNITVALLNVNSHEYSHKEISDLISRYYTARNQRFLGPFKDAIEDYVSHGFNKLSDIDKKMVRMYYRMNATRSLLRSPDASGQIHEYRRHLKNSKAQFSLNLEKANDQFSHTVDDPDILAAISSEFHDHETLHHKERTPIKVTVPIYKKFMRLCPDRFVRQTLWQTYNRRCSPKGLPKTNNLNVIDDLRVFRRKIADLSGFRSHVDYRLEDSMAKSRQRISDTIASLNEENIKVLNDRVQELTDFAIDNSNDSISKTGLKEYDIDFWTHKYAHDILIGQSEAQLRTYFDFPVVMNGMKKFFKDYFDIELKSRHKEIKYWDEGVQTIDVRREEKLIGTIIYDPHHRAEKRVIEPFYARVRTKTKDSGLAPVRLVSTSFKQDHNTKQVQLSFPEIADLFHSFAVVLQRLMYNYEYYELNTYGGLEVEANGLFPNLCSAYLLSSHKILQDCSLREGSKPIDSELATRILKSTTYFKSFTTWRELYIAHLDLEAHTNLRDITKIATEIYPIYSPFELNPEYYDYCAYAGIFVGPSDGVQYSHLWSKQMANFCLSETKMIADNQRMDQDMDKVRSFNTKLIDSLFAPDNFNSGERLLSLTGKSFEPTKTGLGVL